MTLEIILVTLAIVAGFYIHFKLEWNKKAQLMLVHMAMGRGLLKKFMSS